MDWWSPSLIRSATSEGMILLRGTSREIFRPESLRTIGTDSIPAAEQVGGGGDAGITSAAIKTLPGVLRAAGLVTVYVKIDAVVVRADGTNFRLVNSPTFKPSWILPAVTPSQSP